MSQNANDFSFDPMIEKYYSQGKEKDRLKSGGPTIEMERTFAILKKSIPSPPAIILDIGGGAGAYAFPLAEQGYEVHLIDPVPLHIEQAKEYEKLCSSKLASCSIGDARSIDKQDNFADVVLFLGPLYHLIDRRDRLRGLREAYRTLKPGGILVAAAISRFASLMDGIYRGMLFDPKYREIVDKDLATGQHRGIDSKYFTTAYLHHPQELKDEIEEGGFPPASLYAVEGPVWDEAAIANMKKDADVWQKLLSFLEMIENDETIIGASAHIIALAKKQN